MAELAGELADRVAHLVRLLPDLAWPPVLAAQLIENGAADAQRGEAAELLVRLAVPTQAFEQPDHADLLHVFAVEHLIRLQRQLAHDALDQRQILHQPALLGARREQRMAGRAGGVVVDGTGGVHGAGLY